ncbi:MAG: Hsp33 family molecular chaperone HslO [Pseudomonadota bacterium]
MAELIWDDTVLPFQLKNADIRGRVARLDGVLNDVLGQHDYPLEVAGLVAEAAMLTALIGQTIKLRWKLSLQIRGDGPLRLVATDYYGPEIEGGPARVRAYASYDKELLPIAPGNAFDKIGKGMFAILIDQGKDTVPYQGITPLAGGSLAACASTYFAQSEQLPTHFQLRVGVSEAPGDGGARWRGGALMIQHLPKEGEHVAATKDAAKAGSLLTAADLMEGEAAEDWNRSVILLDSVEDLELVGPHVTSAELLYRLYHEEEPLVGEAQKVRFGCSCGPEKVEYTMSIYSSKDIEKMTNDEGKVTADCQFCGAHYQFEPNQLGQTAYGAKYGKTG